MRAGMLVVTDDVHYRSGFDICFDLENKRIGGIFRGWARLADEDFFFTFSDCFVEKLNPERLLVLFIARWTSLFCCRCDPLAGQYDTVSVKTRNASPSLQIISGTKRARRKNGQSGAGR